MNDALDQELRDQARGFRAGAAEPAGGLDEAVARARARRRTRRTVASAAVVVLLVVVAAGALRVRGDRDDVAIVPATDPTTTVPTTATTVAPVETTAVPSTTIPVTTVPVTPVPTSTTTSAPSTTVPPAAVGAIDGSGVLGVAFGTPMDEAVARLSATLGPPDSDGSITPQCGNGPTRVVRWGTLEIHTYQLPGDDTLRTLAYGWGPDGRPATPATPLLSIGGQPLGGPPRPMADVEATVRSLLPDATGEGTAQDMFMVWNDHRKVDVSLATTAGGTTMTAISVFDQTTGTNGCS